jgi:ABC-type multidrug transport system fused ATPase/permease subunit
MLSSFYKPNSGVILINDENISLLSESYLKSNISPVLQDPYLFNDTFANNILFASLDKSLDEVIDATKKARIYDEIMENTEGFNTIVGENGSTISGGQKQRIEIARVLLKDSKVMLFDEATSALDKTNLNYINDLLIELGKEKIILIIAHRLAIMRRCNKVFVLDEGNIIDSGSHNDLLRSCDYYAKLFNKSSQTEEAERTLEGSK